MMVLPSLLLSSFCKRVTLAWVAFSPTSPAYAEEYALPKRPQLKHHVFFSF